MMFIYGVLISIFIYIALGWKLVPSNHVGIIERLGSYYKTLEKGIYFHIPIIDQMRSIVLITPQEKELELLKFATKDDKSISLVAKVNFQIIDPKIYSYSQVNPLIEINKVIEETLLNEIVNINYNEFGEVVNQLNTLLLEEILKQLPSNGVSLNKVSLIKIIK